MSTLDAYQRGGDLGSLRGLNLVFREAEGRVPGVVWTIPDPPSRGYLAFYVAFRGATYEQRQGVILGLRVVSWGERLYRKALLVRDSGKNTEAIGE